MDIDLRIILGLLFMTLGFILVVTGLVIGQSLDLLCGFIMGAFGAGCYIVAQSGREKA